MTEIVNLRRFRKQRAKAAAGTAAAQNRALHGRTAAQKAVERQEHLRSTQALDGHRLAPAQGAIGAPVNESENFTQTVAPPSTDPSTR